MRSFLLRATGVLSIIWSGFFLLIALVMSTGLADEPGDTDGLRRFLFFFTIFVMPGIIVAVISHRALPRKAKLQEPTSHGFPVIQSQTQRSGREPLRESEEFVGHKPPNF